MIYKCPVCNYVVKGNRDMANHMLNNSICSEIHQEWIELNGIDYIALTRLRDGHYKRLIAIIEKECVVRD